MWVLAQHTNIYMYVSRFVPLTLSSPNWINTLINILILLCARRWAGGLLTHRRPTNYIYVYLYKNTAVAGVTHTHTHTLTGRRVVHIQIQKCASFNNKLHTILIYSDKTVRSHRNEMGCGIEGKATPTKMRKGERTWTAIVNECEWKYEGANSLNRWVSISIFCWSFPPQLVDFRLCSLFNWLCRPIKMKTLNTPGSLTHPFVSPFLVRLSSPHLLLWSETIPYKFMRGRKHVIEFFLSQLTDL